MRCIITLALTIILGQASPLIAEDLAQIPWNPSNIQTLRSVDKVAVANFVSQIAGTNGSSLEVKPRDIGDSSWFDLAGNELYELVLTLDSSGRGYFNVLAVYTQRSPGNVGLQNIEGWGIGADLSKVVKDLNADGKYEFIILTQVAPGTLGGWYPTSRTPTWPAVYRLKDGKYIEASREFPAFYDTQVLPRLDKEITKASKEAVSAPEIQDSVAELMLEKDKILRVIGRDPTAGLQHAREWTNSEDPQLVQCAIAVFADIGGHEEELHAAKNTMQAAMARQHAAARE